ncbi:AAA family ATPase [Burkholderia contaminans]|uniref:Recombinase RecF n=1 Tax=Burkholderia contaminans TaxID=488447 RepID=A0A3N8QRU9_9BURK|nr:AAA family ATPase [Burkholderia contaminans]RQT26101.1 recombinase RecF [Burkholderia contaminans]
MDFLKLRAVNFLTLGDTGDMLLKDRGLIAIMGENKDDSSAKSNGSGKSSIADALCWALFGATARGESGDSIINRKAKKNTYAAVTVQDGESIYEIRRHRKDKQFKNGTTITVWNPADHYFNGGGGERIEKGTEKEIQAQINEIVGCTYEVFKAAIYAGQEDMPDLPKMTDKPLKMLIEKAAGIERLEKAYEIAGKKRDAAVAAVESSKKQIENAEAHIVNWKVSLQQAEQQHAQFEAGRPDVQKGWVERQEAIADAMRKNFTTYQNMKEPELIAERDLLQAQLADHNKLLQQRDALIRDENNARSELRVAQVELGKMRNKVVTLTDAIKNAPEAMSKPCGECGKPHTPDELDTFITHQKTKGAEVATEYQAKRSEVEALEAKVTAAGKAVSDYAATIPDVSAVSARVAELNSHISSAQHLKSVLQQQKTEHDRCATQAAAALTAVNPHQSAVDMGRQQIDALEKQVADIKAAQAPLLQAAEVAESVVKVFGPAGVRAQILDTVTPFLNDRTSDYLSALSDGNISAVWSTLASTTKGEAREKFHIDVENSEGADNFGGLSGGEKRKVRLATMLALQDLVASRAAKPISLWVGDEIDDALDNSGLERLMTVLEQKAREKGTVLIISHESLSDWCDQTATVTKSGGVSTVSGALCHA